MTNSSMKLLLRKKSDLTLAQAKIILAKCVDDVSQVEKYRKVRTPILIAEEAVVDLNGGKRNDPYDPDYILRLEAYAFPDERGDSERKISHWREFFLNVADRMMKEMGEEAGLLTYGSKTYPIVWTE